MMSRMVSSGHSMPRRLAMYCLYSAASITDQVNFPGGAGFEDATLAVSSPRFLAAFLKPVELLVAAARLESTASAAVFVAAFCRTMATAPTRPRFTAND